MISYEIVAADDDVVIIRDTSNIYGGKSITNGAEEVVRNLAKYGNLTDRHRLMYYDSEGQLDEIGHRDGKFLEFRCRPQTYRAPTPQIRTFWPQGPGQNMPTAP